MPSLKEEMLALKPPFTISAREQYRDASGTYACPHCHWKHGNVRLRVGMTECPSCHAALIWSLD